ncbi:MAG: MT-A70 family methyltransferase [Variovorax sp.]
MRYTAHPAADAFPLLPADRLQQLADDIKTTGLREPIRLYDGMILDGRNRYAACELAGVAPAFVQVSADIDPWGYVWSLNGERRDLTADQRYLIWKDCSEHSAAWMAEQQRIQDEANRKRSEAAKVQHEVSNPRAGETVAEKPVQPQVVARPETESLVVAQVVPVPETAHKTREAKAAASKTNRGTVERMDRLVRDRPDLAEKVKVGELPAASAIRELKRAEIVERLEDISAREVKAASGLYDVVVIDPPWPMQKIEREVRPNQSEFDYPTMSEDELRALEIPAADDCHVWLWTTHKFLPMAFRLLDAWGLKYVCTFVWHKPGGFQPIGLPQYNCEMALYARKGTPKFIDTKAFPVCFNAPRGAHSEKPEEFYDIVRRVTAGRRVDVFNRRRIDGFDGWGNESV